MSNSVIKVENLGKLYRLGEVGTGTISHDLNRWWSKLRGKEDPFSKVATVNDRTQKAQKGEHVWALKDISFEVRQGEVLGIIGKNGAGKSTLLKLLSRVTSPSAGRISIKGRVASLLEVGTGFHPEMTGRENIYMNGTILGMTKKEISSKLDAIVDFAGVAKYLDTPTKRYSSGMQVRLAFAVAAFLEPEILIVDEVLAVGDAEFQKRAIGKMQEVSKSDGRTVLFVSHNMASVKGLCKTGLILGHGTVQFKGTAENAVDFYLNENRSEDNIKNWGKEGNVLDENVVLHEISVKSNNEDPSVLTTDGVIDIKLSLTKKETLFNKYDFTIQVKDQQGQILFPIASSLIENLIPKEAGSYDVCCQIPKDFFNVGKFYINLMLVQDTYKVVHSLEDIIVMNLQPGKLNVGEYSGRVNGFLRPHFPWVLQKQSTE